MFFGGKWGALEEKKRKFSMGNSSEARATREGLLIEMGSERFSYVKGVVRRK